MFVPPVLPPKAGVEVPYLYAGSSPDTLVPHPSMAGVWDSAKKTLESPKAHNNNCFSNREMKRKLVFHWILCHWFAIEQKNTDEVCFVFDITTTGFSTLYYATIILVLDMNSVF